MHLFCVPAFVALNDAKHGIDATRLCQERPKREPRQAQDTPERAKTGPRQAPDRPRQAQDRPKRLQERPQERPRGTQERPGKQPESKRATRHPPTVSRDPEKCPREGLKGHERPQPRPVLAPAGGCLGSLVAAVLRFALPKAEKPEAKSKKLKRRGRCRVSE